MWSRYCRDCPLLCRVERVDLGKTQSLSACRVSSQFWGAAKCYLAIPSFFENPPCLSVPSLFVRSYHTGAPTFCDIILFCLFPTLLLFVSLLPSNLITDPAELDRVRAGTLKYTLRHPVTHKRHSCTQPAPHRRAHTRVILAHALLKHKVPIDFETIEERADAYETLHAFYADVALLFHNADLTITPGSQVCCVCAFVIHRSGNQGLHPPASQNVWEITKENVEFEKNGSLETISRCFVIRERQGAQPHISGSV